MACEGEEIKTPTITDSVRLAAQKKLRGVCRGKLTLYKKYLDSLKQPLSADQLIDLQMRTDRIKTVFDDFSTCQDHIEGLVTESEYESQLEVRESFENDYYRAVSLAAGRLVKQKSLERPVASVTNYDPEKYECIRYPEIALPTFEGDVKSWIEFRDTFDAIINQSKLKPIQKYKYLRSCLKDSAAEVIASLEYNEESYELAWRLLCERYNNPRVLVNNHLKALFNVDNVPATPTALRSLVDNISKHLRTIKSLDVEVENWDLLIIFFLSTKLDSSIQKKWEEKIASKELPNLQEFKSFLRARADLLDTLNSTNGAEGKPSSSTNAAFVAAAQPNPRGNQSNRCPNCKEPHYINQCPKFLALNMEARTRTIKKLRLCLNCLRSNHVISDCRASRCRVCKGKHHSLLHNYTSQPKVTTLYEQSNQSSNTPTHVEGQPTSKASTSVVNTSLINPKQEQGIQKAVVLSTALVDVLGSNNQIHTLRILLDSGASSNFLSQAAYERLNLPKQPMRMEVRGFNGNITQINHYCNLTIHSKTDSYTLNISCFIVPTLCKLPQLGSQLPFLKIPNRFKLADSHFDRAEEVDMILGAEQFYNILCIGQHRLGKGLPTLQKTRFGWVISGAVSFTPPKQFVECNLVVNHSETIKQVNQIMGEPRQCSKLPNDEMNRCEEIFMTHSRTSDGNFVVTIPLKEDPSVLGRSRHIAYKRLRSLELKFIRNPQFKELYVTFMREFERSGHMTKVDGPLQGYYNFLPHHAVVNFEKQSTPLRVVYDASCPTTSNLSFNDIQYKGAMEQDQLTNILIRFRIGSYVVSADITRMYCSIHINPAQRNLQCILWRESPDQPIGIYTLNTLSFGLKCAPYLATRCLRNLADDNKNQFPEAANAIATAFYMDDYIYSHEDEHKLAEIVSQVDRILKEANFKLRKWRSNSQAVLNAVSTNTNTTQPNTLVPLGGESNKILGLAWCQESDNLTFELKFQVVGDQLTKRKALSLLSSIFDPLGLISPVLITGKLFMQQLFADKKGWDDKLPQSLVEQFKIFYESLSILNTLSVPRHVIIPNYNEVEIHGFADSSMTAYGAVIYLRSVDRQGNIYVQLLSSKSRIAKRESVPRLELRAAGLLATLCKVVRETIKISVKTINLWSDSTIALAWIRAHHPNVHCFINNKVKEIRSSTEINDWHWVSTQDNPADLISRGIPAAGLVRCSKWWQGPLWLQKPRAEWPCSELPNKAGPKPEPVLCCTTVEQEPNLFIQDLVAKYSNDTKLFRVLSYMMRFINNSRHPNKSSGPLTKSELENATKLLIKHSQIESFPNEYNLLKNKKPIPKRSSLLSLNPFMDPEGIIRVGGRLGKSAYTYEKKHPAILSHKHTLTRLTLRNNHVRYLHAGPQLLLSLTRERIWPTHGKSLANKVVRECVTCFKVNPQTTAPIMGDLVLARTTRPAYVFEVTSLDYGGPFTLRDRRGRGYKCYKCYICIFVCFSTKAVHIEAVTSLESQAFIAALRRFIARRGKPRELVSDNATTFVGANNELKELYQFLTTNSSDLMTFAANEHINWKSLIPYSPHQGGLHEGAIKSCKFHLKRIVGQALLTYEEFATYLSQIEMILNSRPLCPIPSSDSDDISTLTPAHFLIGRSLTCLPDYDYQGIPVQNLTHFQHIQQMQQDFWRQWARDYVGLLQQRTKWRVAKGPALRVGTVVLVKDAKLPPCCWQLGRITECHEGQDGSVRIATIKTGKTTIKRAFNNICVLPMTE